MEQDNSSLEVRLFGSYFEVDNDFDESFYEEIYPEVKDYYLPAAALISNRKRLFHHYINYGQNRFKNRSEFEEYLFGLSQKVSEEFEEFDSQFYEKAYPEAKSYFPAVKALPKRKPFYHCAMMNPISHSKRLFCHFINHGKEKGFFKNEKELLKDRKQKILSITKGISFKIVGPTVLANNQQLFWQYPAATEQFYYEKHKNLKSENVLYFAFPWATLIDKIYSQVWEIKTKKNIGLGSWLDLFDKESLRSIKELLKNNSKVVTVCQHIHWKDLVGIWDEIGITDAFVSHLEQSHENQKIRFHSWPLMASNAENKERSRGLIYKKLEDRKYLFSFVGAYNPKKYRSEIREELKIMLSKDSRGLFEVCDEWFYEKIVYEEQMGNKKLSSDYYHEHAKMTQRYNQILSESIFSMCPEGTGPNTVRLWESLAVGAIPVVFSDNWIPPKAPNVNWDDFCVFIRHDQIKDTLKILESLSKSEVELMQKNCIDVYNRFRDLTCF